ncbi:hypothetical protein PITCH_A1810004 [uncultured Desulfobacterium sp.]|uniref:Uncharacterized protein n=1 Tax=uncultured Desulfobacterium sp. TaxID=201089 RepID=A0A445MVE9_9BACT|nr:hypothetical protein PITCH_A1810004 [uncultured Desulfobacterium sp.]
MVPKSNWANILGDRKYYMKIMDWQDFLFPCINPSFLVQALTLGAMPIPAGMIEYGEATTCVTSVFMPPKFCCPADLDGSHGSEVSCGQLVVIPVQRPVCPKYIGNLYRPYH